MVKLYKYEYLKKVPMISVPWHDWMFENDLAILTKVQKGKCGVFCVVLLRILKIKYRKESSAGSVYSLRAY